MLFEKKNVSTHLRGAHVSIVWFWRAYHIIIVVPGVFVLVQSLSDKVVYLFLRLLKHVFKLQRLRLLIFRLRHGKNVILTPPSLDNAEKIRCAKIICAMG